MSDGPRWRDRRENRGRPLVRRLRYARADMRVVATGRRRLDLRRFRRTHATATTRRRRTTPLPPLAPAAAAPPPGTSQAPREKGRWYGWELIAERHAVPDPRGRRRQPRPESGLGSAGLTVGLAGHRRRSPRAALHSRQPASGRLRAARAWLGGRIVDGGIHRAPGWGNDLQRPGRLRRDRHRRGRRRAVRSGVSLRSAARSPTHSSTISGFHACRCHLVEPAGDSRADVYPRPGGGGLGLVGTF